MIYLMTPVVTLHKNGVGFWVWDFVLVVFFSKIKMKGSSSGGRKEELCKVTIPS